MPASADRERRDAVVVGEVVDVERAQARVARRFGAGSRHWRPARCGDGVHGHVGARAAAEQGVALGRRSGAAGRRPRPAAHRSSARAASASLRSRQLR
ncbi:MAG: hypothetical protein MZV65_32955 [Chromatiales bacterium]|nr:hypothetical protein [Chromatiales bacterium]